MILISQKCRYVSRPPVASERLALTASGQVRNTLKRPYGNGTTQIALEPLDLMARLAALVPTPGMHLTRYYGVLAPHSQHRAAVTDPVRKSASCRPTDHYPDCPRAHQPTWLMIEAVNSSVVGSVSDLLRALPST